MRFDEVRHRVSIAGRVIDAAGGVPLAHVPVVIVGARTRETATNAAGIFWSEDLPDGKYSITVKVPDRRAAGGQRVGTANARASATSPKPAWVEVTVGSE